MSTLIVVDNPRSWPLELKGVEIIPARSYLTDPYFNSLRRTKVFTCRGQGPQAHSVDMDHSGHEAALHHPLRLSRPR